MLNEITASDEYKDRGIEAKAKLNINLEISGDKPQSVIPENNEVHRTEKKYCETAQTKYSKDF